MRSFNLSTKGSHKQRFDTTPLPRSDEGRTTDQPHLIRRGLRLVPWLALASLIWIGGCDGGDASDGDAVGARATESLQLAVIAKSTVNAYWKAVESGARRAAQDLNVRIIWTGPDAETNHTQQASIVDNMVNRGVDGIVLAPTNYTALVRPVESAVARGVPVILIDSTLDSDAPRSVIATDNAAAGRLAANAVIEAIGEDRPFGGKVLMLRFLEGSGSTEAREQGFADRITEAPGLELVDSMYTKGAGSTTDAADTADALLRRFTANNRVEVDGIFASNQPTAIGMLRKLEQFRAQGIAFEGGFVGFDAHDVLLEAVRERKIDALVVQNPLRMGELGVRNMVALLRGEPIEPAIATEAITVTLRNIDEPRVRRVTLQDPPQ